MCSPITPRNLLARVLKRAVRCWAALGVLGWAGRCGCLLLRTGLGVRLRFGRWRARGRLGGRWPVGAGLASLGQPAVHLLLEAVELLGQVGADALDALLELGTEPAGQP
jgi:hypothetical protein